MFISVTCPQAPNINRSISVAAGSKPNAELTWAITWGVTWGITKFIFVRTGFPDVRGLVCGGVAVASD